MTSSRGARIDGVLRRDARGSRRANPRPADHPVARRRTEQELLVEPDVLGDHALRAEPADGDRPAGRAVAVRRFSTERMVAEHVRLYEELLFGPTPRYRVISRPPVPAS